MINGLFFNHEERAVPRTVVIKNPIVEKSWPDIFRSKLVACARSPHWKKNEKQKS